MEIITKGTRQVLVASEGYVLQSVTDGLIIGRTIILGKKDSINHYHEIPEPIQESENTSE